jgi:hypothetical protein
LGEHKTRSGGKLEDLFNKIKRKSHVGVSVTFGRDYNRDYSEDGTSIEMVRYFISE